MLIAFDFQSKKVKFSVANQIMSFKMIIIYYLLYLILLEFTFLIDFKTKYKVLKISNENELFNVKIINTF